MDSAPLAASANIDALSNEVLLQIFECGLSPSTLLTCTLTSKRWTDLASTVLYRHVVLSTQVLTRWLASGPPSRDSSIESLTLRIDGVGSGPGSDLTTAAMEQLRRDLELLPSRLAHIHAIRSFSFRTPKSLPTGMWVPGSLLVAILDQLPVSCSSLEVDTGATYNAGEAAPKICHVCPSIRRLIPQLQYLRIGLPMLCSKAFGQASDSNPASFDPVQAPSLDQCLITVAKQTVPASVLRTQACGSPDRNIVTLLANCLQAFSSTDNAPRLEQLWILDALPLEDQSTSFPSLVRRDVMAGKSLALPYKNIGARKVGEGGVLMRIPAGGDTGDSADIVTSLDGVRAVAEGNVWAEATTGARLPSRVIFTSSLIPTQHVEKTAGEWLRETNTSCLLWMHETMLKTKILSPEEGDLMEDCIPHLRLPEGWLINEGGMLEAVDA